MDIFLLFFLALVLMSAKGCSGYNLEGDQIATVYPSKNLARVRTITQSCPLKVSDAKNIQISDLPDGGCWIPQSQCDKYARDYESKVCE